MLFSQCVPLLRSSKPIIEKLDSIIDDKDDTLMGTAEPSFLNEIRASDLCFRYKEAVPVPEGFDLTIQKGRSWPWWAQAAAVSPRSLNC